MPFRMSALLSAQPSACLCLPVHPYVCRSVHSLAYLSVCLCPPVSVCLSVFSWSVRPSLLRFFHPSSRLSVCLSDCLSAFLAVHPSFLSSAHPSIWLSVWVRPSVRLPVFLVRLSVPQTVSLGTLKSTTSTSTATSLNKRILHAKQRGWVIFISPCFLNTVGVSH